MKSKALLAAAVAGLLGGTLAHAGEMKKGDKTAKKSDNVNCYGVNKCAGHGQCAGEAACAGMNECKGHACGGKNSCKGQGWLPIPKDSCLNIEGGSLEPVKKKG